MWPQTDGWHSPWDECKIAGAAAMVRREFRVPVPDRVVPSEATVSQDSVSSHGAEEDRSPNAVAAEAALDPGANFRHLSEIPETPRVLPELDLQINDWVRSSIVDAFGEPGGLTDPAVLRALERKAAPGVPTPPEHSAAELVPDPWIRSPRAQAETPRSTSPEDGGERVAVPASENGAGGGSVTDREGEDLLPSAASPEDRPLSPMPPSGPFRNPWARRRDSRSDEPVKVSAAEEAPPAPRPEPASVAAPEAASPSSPSTAETRPAAPNTPPRTSHDVMEPVTVAGDSAAAAAAAEPGTSADPEEWIGRYALCGLGRVGRIDGVQELEFGRTFVGTRIHDGQLWATTDPRRIDDADAHFLDRVRRIAEMDLDRIVVSAVRRALEAPELQASMSAEVLGELRRTLGMEPATPVVDPDDPPASPRPS